MLWLWLALGAALLTGINIVIEKEALLKEHAMEFTTVLSIFAFLITLVLIPYVDFYIGVMNMIYIYIASILITVVLLFEAKGIRHLEVSEAAPLLTLGPAFTALLAFIILKETMSALNIFGIFLIVAGAYYLESHKLTIHFLHPLKKLVTNQYTFYILFAMLILSFLVIIDKVILVNIDVYTFIFFYSFFSMINFIFLIYIFHDGFKGIVHGIKKAGKWILPMAVMWLFARLFYFSALTMYKASLVYPVLKMNAFFSTLIGGALFHEHHLKTRVITSIIMVLGVLFVAL